MSRFSEALDELLQEAKFRKYKTEDSVIFTDEKGAERTGRIVICSEDRLTIASGLEVHEVPENRIIGVRRAVSKRCPEDPVGVEVKIWIDGSERVGTVVKHDALQTGSLSIECRLTPSHGSAEKRMVSRFPDEVEFLPVRRKNDDFRNNKQRRR